jgi:hypothetical protein
MRKAGGNPAGLGFFLPVAVTICYPTRLITATGRMKWPVPQQSLEENP